MTNTPTPRRRYYPEWAELTARDVEMLTDLADWWNLNGDRRLERAWRTAVVNSWGAEHDKRELQRVDAQNAQEVGG
jgi:hypothetical protein